MTLCPTSSSSFTFSPSSVLFVIFKTTSTSPMEVCMRDNSLQISPIFIPHHRAYWTSPKNSMSPSWTRSHGPFTLAVVKRSAAHSIFPPFSITLTSSQQQMAQQVLTQLEEHPDAWTRVPEIMERSSFQQSKVHTSLPAHSPSHRLHSVYRSPDP